MGNQKDIVKSAEGRKTALGLFNDASSVNEALRKIEALGIPRKEIRTLEEPERFEVSGAMNFPRLDFEVELTESLAAIGVNEAEAEAYIQQLRKGAILVFATGSDGRVDAAAETMKRNGAVNITKGHGPEPHLPHAVRGVRSARTYDDPEMGGQSGRIPSRGSGYFVW